MATPEETQAQLQAQLDEMRAMLATQQPTKPEARSVNWPAVLITCFVLFVIGLSLTAGVGVFVYKAVTDKTEQVVPVPDDRPDRALEDLVDEIERARLTKTQAVYLQKVYKGIAGRLEADGDFDEPRLAQRKDISDKLGETGYWAVIGSEARDIRDLPEIIELAFEDVFETDDDGNYVGGELTSDDREEVIERFENLSKAFETVAKTLPMETK